MELTTLVDLLEPHIIRLLQSSRVTLSSAGGGVDSGMKQHALFGTYHTGQLDESQALWVSPLITNRIADHSAQADVHHAQLHSILDPSHHSVSGGLALDVFGQTGPGVIARLTPKHSPGAAAELLRTDTDGSITLPLMRTSRLIGNVDDLTLEAVDDIILSPTSKVYSTVKVGILNADATYELDVTGSGRLTVKLITPRVEAENQLTLAPTSTLFLSPGDSFVKVTSNVTLQSDNFQSQLLGWRMTYTGELDTRYIYSDQLKVKLFIADITQALAGSEIITKSVSTLALPFRIPFPGSSEFIYIDDLPSAENMAFGEANDFIRIREFSRAGGGLSITDSWGTISAYVDQANKIQRWTFTRSGTNSGALIAQVGTRRIANTSTTSSTVTKVTGTANGHTMFAFVVLNRQTTITPPSGFTEIYSANISTGKVALFRKVAGASEPTNYTFTFGTSGENMVSLYCYSNVNTTSSYFTEFKTSVQSGFAASVLQGQSVWGASSQGDMILLFAGMVGNHTGGAPPPGMTERSDQHWNGVGTYMAEWKLEGSGDTGEMPVSLTTDAYSITITMNLLPTYTLSLETGFLTPGTLIGADAVILDYGVSGNGWIESTTVDGIYGSNSPYTRIVSWTTHPATGAVVRAQMGHLRGLFGVANEYGFYAGNGVMDSSTYIRLTSSSVRLNNVPIQLWNTGQQKVNIDSEGIDVWVGNGFGDKRLSWDGFGLSIKGSVTISDVSGFAGSGFLRVGTGTKDVNLNGWQMDIGEIVGQAAGVDQVVLNTSGKILAGASSVLLDSNGLTILGDSTDQHASQSRTKGVTFTLANGTTIIGRTLGYYLSGTNTYGVELYSRSPDAENSYVRISAERAGIIYGGGSAGNPKILMFSGTDESIAFYASGQMGWYCKGSASADLLLSQFGFFVRSSMTLGTNAASVDYDGTLSLGNTTVDYTPIASTWNSTGSTLLLNALNYSTIAFHDSGVRVDYIRVGAGTMTLGYDGGFGAAQVLFGGVIGSGWTALSYYSGWTHYDSGWTGGHYKKVGDLVFIRGLVKRVSGSLTIIAQLPVGFRPAGSCMITGMTDTGVGRIDISTDGNITLISGGTGWVSLFNTVFSTL